MGNHRAAGRAQVRQLRTSTVSHRGSAFQAGVVKVGVLGALATATIAVPLASAAASGTDQTLPLQHDTSVAETEQTQEQIKQVADSAPVQIEAVPAVAVSETAASDSALVAPAVADPGQAVTVDTAGNEQPVASTADAATPLTVQAAPEPVTVVDEATGAVTVTGGASAPSAEGYIHPVAGAISSGYGMRVHPVLGYAKMHDGVDFAAACGTEVQAAAAGTVIAVEYNSSSGNRVKIDHGNGVVTGYYHLSEFKTTVGATVAQGDTIGLVGSTGRSTGCHLHLIKADTAGTYSDPMSLFK